MPAWVLHCGKNAPAAAGLLAAPGCDFGPRKSDNSNSPALYHMLSWKGEKKKDCNFLQKFIVCGLFKLWFCNFTVWVEAPLQECGAWWQWGTPLDLKDNSHINSHCKPKNKSAFSKLPAQTDPSHLWWRSDCSHDFAAADGASWCVSPPRSPCCTEHTKSINNRAFLHNYLPQSKWKSCKTHACGVG